MAYGPTAPEYHNDLYTVPETGIEVAHPDLETYLPYPQPGLEVQSHQVVERPPGQDRAGVSRICGLKKRTFWIVIIMAVIIVMATLIGALVGKLVPKDDKTNSSSSSASESTGSASFPKSSQTSTASSTSASFTATAAAPIETTRITHNNVSVFRTCPSSNNTNYTSPSQPGIPSQNFEIHCDWLPDFARVNSEDPLNEINPDKNFTANSLEGCINQCARYNSERTSDEYGPCGVVMWRWDYKIDYWTRCWGGFGPVDKSDIRKGRSSKDPAEAPADTALLLDGL